MIDLASIFNQIAFFAFDILYVAIIIGTIIVILLDNRNPVKTIAWIMVLTFLPIVGLVFYFFFGRDQRRQRIISKKSYTRLFKRPFKAYTSQNLLLPSTSNYYRLIHLFKNINNSYLFEGNKLSVYTNGYDKMAALIRQLYRAKDHIHIEYYIFEDDSLGRLIRDILIDKARQGVEIRVIYDDVGCWDVPDRFYQEMRDVGIEVRSFLKVRFPLFTSKVNYRNHRKIAVIDGKVGFVGGMNIANRYVKGVEWGVWRDTHLMIEGKAVYGLQSSFLLDWYFVDQSLITSSRYFPNIENRGEMLAQVVTSEPISLWPEIMQGLVKAIISAKKYFYIQTPYFLPTEQVLGAMQIASLSGVDVRLMLPKKADNCITNFASHSYIKDVLRAGVKVYFYEKGFLHSKLMVSDDTFATIGSTNLDFRSFEHNFEVNTFIYDEDFAQQMKAIYLKDEESCSRVLLRRWSKRPLKQRAVESIVRLLAPLL